MAEISIQLNAEDRTPPVLNAVFENTRSKAADISSFMQRDAQVVEASLAGVGGVILAIITALGSIVATVRAFDDSIADLHDTVKSIEKQLKEGIEVKLDTEGATKALKSVLEEAEKINAEKSLSLDVSHALSAVSEVKTALASIPDVTYSLLLRCASQRKKRIESENTNALMPPSTSSSIKVYFSDKIMSANARMMKAALNFIRNTLVKILDSGFTVPTEEFPYSLTLSSCCFFKSRLT